jgi:hypothetical protein
MQFFFSPPHFPNGFQCGFVPENAVNISRRPSVLRIIRILNLEPPVFGLDALISYFLPNMFHHSNLSAPVGGVSGVFSIVICGGRFSIKTYSPG